ncbi:MAG: hypothetical protein EU539_14090 [Promethearchaeota archaeon]|nr:MAG: hypothetical protein EU539_14090 [Candidatus Lokiarchaeota archaeon]
MKYKNSQDISGSRRLKCAICHECINQNSNYFQSKCSFNLICEDCSRRFSEEDIELVISIFFLFGGYFGKTKKLKFSILEVLGNLINHFENDGDEMKLDSINIRLLHQALLHGITPQEFVKKVEFIAEYE